MKVKHFYLIFALLAFSCNLFAQNAPNIEWSKTFGGSNIDQATSIEQTKDSGFIIAGATSSKGTSATDYDGGITKLKSDHTVEWQLTYGGSGDDWINAIHQTKDSGYIVAGYTTSIITGYRGSSDYWVMKLDKKGALVWQRAMGGSGIDIANAIVETKDVFGDNNGYIIAGYSESNDGDVSPVGLNKDYWIVKINLDGSIQWQKVFYGSDDDMANDIQQTPDYGYIVAGYSESFDYNFPLNQGGMDGYILKLDNSGNLVWKKNIGGSKDDFPKSIALTNDGGYIVACGSRSNDADVTGNHGSADYWIVKLRSTGSIQWQKSYGGTDYDVANSVKQTFDTGYIVAGYTHSNNGNVTVSKGNDDFWVLKLTATGILEWQKSLGGSNSDQANSVQQTLDSSYIIAGYTYSNDGDVTGNHGSSDYWVVKLEPNPNYYIMNPYVANLINDYGKITTDLSAVKLKNDVKGISTDGVSKVLITITYPHSLKFLISCTAEDGGFYTLDDQDNLACSFTGEPDNSGKISFLYQAPDGYGSYDPKGRVINIIAQNSSGDLILNIPITLLPPPIVMVHGMWSRPAAWEEGGFKQSLNAAGFSRIQLANYEKDNNKTFDPLNPESKPARTAIANAVSVSLTSDSLQQIISSQVDIVGHSLGGLQSRNYSQHPELFIKNQNYYKGYIHKLITIGTPHLGSNWGPLLYNGRPAIAHMSTLGDHQKLFMKVSNLLDTHTDMKIGSCHKDFNPAFKGTKQGLDNLTATNFKVHVITARADSPDHQIMMSASESLIRVLNNTPKTTKFGDLLGDDENDLIVPRYSQQGGINDIANYHFYYNTEHSELFSKNPLSILETETNNPDIQYRVKELLLSNKAQDFASGLPAPNTLSTPFDKVVQPNIHTKVTESPFTGLGRDNVSGNINSSDYLNINSPAVNSVYKNDGSDSIKLSFEFSDPGKLSNAVFMIDGIGLVEVATEAPYTTTIALPANIPSGRLSIAIMANDTTGIIYADTLSVLLSSNDSLLSLSTTPITISLDSSYRATNLQINGLFQTTTGSVSRDLSNTQTGTSYFTKYGNSIIKIDGDGYVSAQRPGVDTITASYGGQSIQIPITVDSNYAFASFYPNAIDFPAISDQPVDAAPFALDATASSGDDVQFTLISGPATVENGVVVINGAGTVTIQATCAGNPYFDSASHVIQSFNVSGVLPLRFLSFSGSLSGNDVKLNWKTANEQNVSYYVVERSTDGLHFDSVGKVYSAGSFAGETSYNFTDKTVTLLSANNLYYRLQETDKDGKTTISSILPIQLPDTKQELIVYPNPASKVINLLVSSSLSKNSFMNVYDLTGKLLMRRQLSGFLSQQFSVAGLSAGTYKIVVFEDNKKTYQQSVVIAH